MGKFEKKVTSGDDIVTVIGTEKSKYMKTGKEYQVSRDLAKTLVKNGQANYKKGE